jgi:ATP-dependent DNA helicase DinG
MPARPSVSQLLAAAVGDLGGSERPGQVAMAEAVRAAMRRREHLLIQAGTGTGKSLAYLVPALLHGRTVVVATATLALQSQLIRRDLPRLADAAEPLLGRRPTFAILKGRGNYVCLNRLDGGGPDEADVLFDDSATSPMGREVVRARAWAEETETGDRDDLVPGVYDRVWSQVSVSSRECIGAARCTFGEDCFAERARAKAAEADIVITNHALLAIDALEGIPVLPEHDVVIVDEAHELVDRVTGVATAELTAAMVERAARVAARVADERAVDILRGVGEGLGATLATVEPGRLEPPPPLLAAELAAVRDAARGVTVSISTSRDDGAEDVLAKRLARAAAEEVFETAGRLAVGSEYDVAWLSLEERRGRVLRVAPLSVAGLLREALFRRRTVVLTSATLELGGTFSFAARSFGLGAELGDPVEAVDAVETVDDEVAEPAGDGEDRAEGRAADRAEDKAEKAPPPPPPWRGLDVGSPFDYRKQAILYVARHLPAPGRDGLSEAALDEIAELVASAGGRALGLFSSRRAAEQAAAALRVRRDEPVLCQGDDTLSELVRRFAAEPATCLFGTMSLWQGVDVPGPACQLVLIDRIPFPRPDEPLSAARARAVDQAGGSGFMAVSAAHAAVRLAQGAGRLIRRHDDRGVVAVLDSRLATARYGDFLRGTMPPFWYTTDRAAAHAALRRIDEQCHDALRA